MQEGAPSASEATENPDALAEIVVTGSRIMRTERDHAADSPTVTVKGDSLTNASQPTVDSMLQRMPQFTGSSGGTGQNATTNGTGLATLNLRNLGDNRNLVLLDGRRMQPSSNTLVVDINSLPIGIIDNVEVITGGASAVYGSDAIAGAVNFKGQTPAKFRSTARLGRQSSSHPTIPGRLARERFVHELNESPHLG